MQNQDWEKDCIIEKCEDNRSNIQICNKKISKAKYKNNVKVHTSQIKINFEYYTLFRIFQAYDRLFIRYYETMILTLLIALELIKFNASPKLFFKKTETATTIFILLSLFLSSLIIYLALYSSIWRLIFIFEAKIWFPLNSFSLNL